MNHFLDLLSQKEFEKYKAHIPTDNSLPKETLWQHSSLTKTYYENIAKANGIDDVLQNIITDIVKEFYVEENQKWANDFIYRLFVYSVVLHDLGKLNPNFQKKKMEERFSFVEVKEGSNHAKLGSFIFFNSFFSEFLENYNNKANDKEKFLTIFLTFVFSIPIFKHHSTRLEKNSFEDIFSKEFIEEAYELLSQKFLSFEKEKIKKAQDNISKKVFSENRNSDNNPFLLFALLKLNYSLLTASDYFATSHFMQNWSQVYWDFGIIDENLRKKLIYNIENSQVYNCKTYQELKGYVPSFPQKTGNEALNKLRQNLAVEVIQNIRKNLDKNLFYLEAPTGGGKTNLSMLALAELLRPDLQEGKGKITKVFYVFPFTTLITQTFKSLQETLGLDENEVIQIHSKAGFSSKIKKEAQEADAVYGKEKENIIDYQFVNYPLALFSHVKFFDILKSNHKADNYILHRLANSVVIIDELQSYTPSHWDKIIFFISNYAKYFNMKFILMSATLPKIDALISVKAENIKNKFVYLIKDKRKYFQNPNFQKRVYFDFSLLGQLQAPESNNHESRALFFRALWEKIKTESQVIITEFGRAHTIIEFIFKKSAGEFFDVSERNNNRFFDEIFLLSGTILEPRRREIIAKLKHLDYAGKNILLITTQVVEAGVDIDMDIGFKDISLIDSDEQLAGRINRNSNKRKSKLFLFNLDDAKTIYGKDMRFEQMEKHFTEDDHKKILESKNFDTIYMRVMEEKNRHNAQYDWADNLQQYLKDMKKLNFNKVHSDFQLIEDQDNVTIFVPLEIPVQIPYSKMKNFNKNELELLAKNKKYVAEQLFVSGAKVLELYEEIVLNKNLALASNFATRKIQLAQAQGLLSKFSFSVGMRSGYFKMLLQIGELEEKFGYYKLQNFAEVYDYSKGLNDSVIINPEEGVIF